MSRAMVGMDDSMASYTHTSQPQAVKSNVMSASLPGNIARDSRVKLVKGSTSGTIRKLVASEKGVTAGNNVNTVRKLKGSGAKPAEYVPPEGTKFFTFDTYPSLKPEIDLYPNLVEQIPPSNSTTFDRELQTDVFIERPESPAYIPAKIGMDTGTQIENSELFDFDLEVIPLLETLVAKTIEQAVFEVNSEEELRRIEDHFQDLVLKSNEEIAENIKREKNFIVDQVERQKHLAAVRKTKEVERELCTRVAASKMMKQILPQIFENTIVDLIREGTLFDPTVSQVTHASMVEVTSSVSHTFQTYDTASQLVDELLQAAQSNFETRWDEEQARLLKIREEEERIKREAEEAEMKKAEEEAKAKADAEAAAGEEGDEEVTEE